MRGTIKKLELLLYRCRKQKSVYISVLLETIEEAHLKLKTAEKKCETLNKRMQKAEAKVKYLKTKNQEV